MRCRLSRADSVGCCTRMLTLYCDFACSIDAPAMLVAEVPSNRDANSSKRCKCQLLRAAEHGCVSSWLSLCACKNFVFESRRAVAADLPKGRADS